MPQPRPRLALEEDVQDAPGQLVIDAEANQVLVQAHALIAWKCRARRRIEIGLILQSDVEIFDLCRPVPGKFELQAAADGPAPVPMLLHDRAWRSERLVFNLGERSAPRRVEQPIVLCVADPPPV